MKRIVCFGPGPKFKGGIANYNTSLAKALDKVAGVEVHIVSWINQYPSIIPRDFIDRNSKQDLLEGTDIQIAYLADFNKPGSWKQTADYIIDLDPDIVIFQWAITIQGLPLGRISKRVRKHGGIEIIFDLHNVVQKESSSLDKKLTKMGIRWADTYITHSYMTIEELKTLIPENNFFLSQSGERSPDPMIKTMIKLYHPIYDIYEYKEDFDIDEFKRVYGLKKHVFLFFGFIRKYKGLHNAIKAFKLVSDKRDDVSLLICGESFWDTLSKDRFITRAKNAIFSIAKKMFIRKSDDEREYRPLELIEELGIEKEVVVVNKYIPNEDVYRYFQASDSVVLFYEYATPSGIESMAYNFKKPLIATRVGYFKEGIVEGYNGYLADPEDIQDMANAMIRSIDHPIHPKGLEDKIKQMSWSNYAKAILELNN